MSHPTAFVVSATLTQLIQSGAILTGFVLEDEQGQFHILARSTNGTDHRLQKNSAASAA